ncbi:MAG: DNA internalization-related competence protein ComEC/Rec2 [Nitrospirota bacterium]
MKRPLIGITIAYIIGMIFGEIFYYFPIFIIISLFSLLIIDSFCKKRIPHSSLLFGIVLFGLIYYQFIASYIPANHISRFISREKITLIGKVVEPVRYYDYKVVLMLEAKVISFNGKKEETSGRVRLSVKNPSDKIAYGDIVRAEVYLKPPRTFKNPGGFDYKQKGIRVTAHTKTVTILSKSSPSFLGYIYDQREKIRKAIVSSLNEPESAILQAMIIGEKGVVTNDIRDNFMASGTAHLLAISGTHLSLVGFLIYTISRWIILYLPQRILLRVTARLIPSQIAAIITLPFVIYYALLSGGHVSTIRAVIMIVIYLSAILIQRDRDLLNSLALAALLVLVYNPQAIFNISFQLSYISVLFISLSIGWWRARSKGNKNSLHKKDGVVSTLSEKILFSIYITITVILATAPLAVYYFNDFSWVGIVSNLLIVPYVGIFVLPVGLFSSILSLLLDLSYLPFTQLNHALLSILYGLIKLFASFPLAELHLPSPSILFLSLFYSFLLLIFYIVSGNKENSRGKLWMNKASIFIGILLVFLFLKGILSPYKDKGILRITYIDVGQGDSALIEFPDMTKMLIDGGMAFHKFDMGRLVVAPYLWDRGIRRIDYIVATHPQLDHIGGLNFLIDKFDIGEVWTNGAEKNSTFYKKFTNRLKERNIPVKVRYKREVPLKIGECMTYILNPAEDGIKETENSSKGENNLSIVLKIVCGERVFLFTGDIENGIEAQMAELGSVILKSDVIKIPHHGGRGSLNKSFISMVDPDIAVISVGENNRYGHPTNEVISFYKGLGTEIYRTDTDGAVILTSNGEDINIMRYIDIRLKKVLLDRNILFNEIKNLKKIVG